MVKIIIVILIILWFFGYTPLFGVSLPNVNLFSINNHIITLWELLVVVLVGWAISILPSQLQTIAVVLLILWILSKLGILFLAGLSNAIIFVIIIALILSIFI